MKSFWPREEKAFSFSFSSEEEIEDFFNNLLTPYRCLLFSSGRSALISCLIASNIKRGKSVWCEKFSSHCVQDAVGFVGNISDSIEHSEILLLNHALGYEVKEHYKLCIEDSVDSFFINSESCFPNEKSHYEIISLPKVLGTFTGGIAICRDKKSFDSLKTIRDSRHKNGIIHNDFIRILKSNSPKLEHIWSSLEKETTRCSTIGNLNIRTHLNNFEIYKKKRLNNLKVCQNSISLPPTVKKGRIPTSIPLATETVSEEYLKSYPHLLRTYSRLSKEEVHYQKCFFLPLHHQISSNWLIEFFKVGLAKKN